MFAASAKRNLLQKRNTPGGVVRFFVEDAEVERELI